MQSPAFETARGVVERYRPVLLVAAIYDGLLGLAFLFLAGPIFSMLGIALVADPVYVQLAAGLIAIMGLGFYFAWRDPLINRDIVLLGVVFKAFYVLLAVYAQLRGEVPHGVFVLFAAIDAVFFVLFLLMVRETSSARTALTELVAGRTQ